MKAAKARFVHYVDANLNRQSQASPPVRDPPVLVQGEPVHSKLATGGEESPAVIAAPAEVENAAERIAEELRRAILRGELLPGEHVRQPDWADRLGVSRSVLREAFKILTTQRLLRHKAQSGYFVSRLSPAEMAELYELRMAVEERVFEAVRWPNEAELLELERCFAAFVDELRAGQIGNAISHSREYVFGLFDLSDRALTAGEAKRLWEMSAPYRSVVLSVMVLRDPELEETVTIGAEQLRGLREHDLDLLVALNKRERLQNLEHFDFASNTGMLALLARMP